MTTSKQFYVFLVLCLLPAAAFSMNIPLPQDLGQVRLDTFTKKAGMAPVIFDHWRHRARFTCRVCHIDIGFAMEQEATGINADLNSQGLYCGACHNGKRVIGDTEVFASCAETYTEKEGLRCVRCHSSATKKQREADFNKFTEDFPRLPAAHLIDWEKAEEQGIIRPIDFLEGLSFKRDHLQAQKDFSIEVTTWASDVIFSHRKHVVWNGCELCHPLIFPSTKRGTNNYSMFQIVRGEYCGVCHLKVAFPVSLCQKCHKNPVR